jgi:hypothetical protein
MESGSTDVYHHWLASAVAEPRVASVVHTSEANSLILHTMVDASEIEQSLAALVAAGPVEVRENGVRLASLATFEYEIRSQSGGTLLHLWSPDRTLARRVLRISEQAPSLLQLEVEHFGRNKPDRLEFASSGERAAAQLTREKFLERFAQMLREQFADEEIVTLSTSADLKNSLSSRYTRGLLKSRDGHWAVLAASPEESASAVDDMLTFGLLWLENVRTRAKIGRIHGLRLFMPPVTGKLVAHRSGALASSTNIEFYELNLALGRARRVDAKELGNVVTWLTARREVEGILAEAAPEIDAVRRLAPDAITASVVPGTREVALRFRGADFARWQNATIFFGLGDHRRALTPDRQHELEQLVHKLGNYRHPAAQDTAHVQYRMQPERWLESQIFADPSRIDARLDPRFLYTQVPAFTAGDRGVVDLLGVTRGGRLAILELKANEDIHLVLQAADYWLRVRWHQQQDDIQRYGYFPGVELRPDPPLLFLVAPAIRFHPATTVILRHISSEIEVARVGLAENWRQRLRVALRQ